MSRRKRGSRNLRRLVLVRITHDPGHTGQRRQLLRRALRVATRYQNAAIRIHPLQPAYRCAGVLIGGLGHGAGIEHNNFGVACRRGALQSTLQKLPFQCGPIRLRRATAKILYVEASHAPILNEWMLRLKFPAIAVPAIVPPATAANGLRRALHLQVPRKRCTMKRRILIVDDDLAVLLTLKAVLELHGFNVDTAASSAEAFVRMKSGVYQMVISDLRMETEEAGLEVLRAAHRQAYDPATALLTAYPPSGEQRDGQQWDGEDWSGENSESLLIKPLGTGDLLRQVEALLIRHADKQVRQRSSAAKAQDANRAG